MHTFPDHASGRRLQSGRAEPTALVPTGLALPGLPQDLLAERPWRKQFRLLAQPLGLIGQTLFQGIGLFETASLHGAAPFRKRKAGAQPGVLITDESQGPGGDAKTMTQARKRFCII